MSDRRKHQAATNGPLTPEGAKKRIAALKELPETPAIIGEIRRLESIIEKSICGLTVNGAIKKFMRLAEMPDSLERTETMGRLQTFIEKHEQRILPSTKFTGDVTADYRQNGVRRAVPMDDESNAEFTEPSTNPVTVERMLIEDVLLPFLLLLADGDKRGGLNANAIGARVTSLIAELSAALVGGKSHAQIAADLSIGSMQFSRASSAINQQLGMGAYTLDDLKASGSKCRASLSNKTSRRGRSPGWLADLNKEKTKQ